MWFEVVVDISNQAIPNGLGTLVIFSEMEIAEMRDQDGF
jgi:hypothetical protein